MAAGIQGGQGMKKLLVLVVIASLGSYGCGSGEQPTRTPFPSCSVVFASGVQTPTEWVTCTDAGGHEVLVALYVTPCIDGSSLVSSAYGWGKQGGVWTWGNQRTDTTNYDQGLQAVMSVCRPGYGNPPSPTEAPAAPATAATDVGPAQP
jgi:hypothetical protein